jgi:hypothetical protein
MLLYWGFIVTFTNILTVYHSWTHPSILLLYLTPHPHSWNSFNMSHFFIFIHECIIFHHIHPPIPCPYVLPPTLVLTTTQDLFYLPILCFCKRHFCLFKISVQSISLWQFHVYRYYSPNWFIPSIFLLFTLVPFLP